MHEDAHIVKLTNLFLIASACVIGTNTEDMSWCNELQLVWNLIGRKSNLP